MNSTYTLTFGDVAENHIGMQKIGNKRDGNFSYKELEILANCIKDATFYDLSEYLPKEFPSDSEIDSKFEDKYYEELEEVEKAGILVIKNGVNLICDYGNPCDYLDDDYDGPSSADLMLEEQKELEYDTQYYDQRRKKVLNKRARWNICFDDEEQEPDYEQGKGTIISFQDVFTLNLFRLYLPEYLKNMYNDLNTKKIKYLKAEGNLYYDINKCGIGYHGDTERNIVIGIRLGETLPLCYQWYYRCKRVGVRFKIDLEHGDIYIMSSKAVGNDWRKRSKITLRHSAGCEKYIK